MFMIVNYCAVAMETTTLEAVAAEVPYNAKVNPTCGMTLRLLVEAEAEVNAQGNIASVYIAPSECKLKQASWWIIWDLH